MHQILERSKSLVLALLGQRATYRIGRSLYQKARGDVRNDMVSNGEMLVQQCVINGWRKQHEMKSDHLVVFDVGANVGKWSEALLHRFAELDVHAVVDLYVFEPVHSAMELLQERLAPYQVSVQYEQSAFSSEDGQGFIYVNGVSSGTNSLHFDQAKNGDEPRQIVKITATTFCKLRNIHEVHLLKCDTEGHDMEVIRGAISLLQDGRIGVLQFEYNHRWIYSRNFLRDVFRAIAGLPYQLAKLQRDHLLLIEEWHPELERFFEGNYALVRQDALSWFPTKCARFDRFNTISVKTI